MHFEGWEDRREWVITQLHEPRFDWWQPDGDGCGGSEFQVMAAWVEKRKRWKKSERNDGHKAQYDCTQLVIAFYS